MYLTQIYRLDTIKNQYQILKNKFLIQFNLFYNLKYSKTEILRKLIRKHQ